MHSKLNAQLIGFVFTGCDHVLVRRARQDKRMIRPKMYMQTSLNGPTLGLLPRAKKLLEHEQVEVDHKVIDPRVRES